MNGARPMVLTASVRAYVAALPDVVAKGSKL